MARAQTYDEYEDPGLAFSPEDLEQYDPTAVAASRQAECLFAVRLLLRMAEAEQPKPETCREMAKRLLSCGTWYSQALGLAGVDLDAAVDLPKANTTAGRKLTAKALELAAPDLLRTLRERAEGNLRRSVTLGRRCEALPGWTKAQRSASNKLANAIIREISCINKLLDAWASTTKGEE